MNDKLFMFLIYKEMHEAGLMDDITWKKFLCNCLVVEYEVMGLDMPEEIKKTLTTYGADDEDLKKTCYNCNHGPKGFDGDSGCDLWHRGKMDATNCKFWNGSERKEE